MLKSSQTREEPSTSTQINTSCTIIETTSKMLYNRLHVAGFCLTMAQAVLGGNVCLSTSLAASFGGGAPDFGIGNDRNQIAFAAGSPCDDSRSATLNEAAGENWCTVINRTPEFEICGKKATIVNKGPSVEHGNDCGAVLSIDSVEYPGRVISRDEEDPCAGSCSIGVAFGNLSGLRIFEGVPMC